ncbi:glycoside hydrolase family 97 protein [Flagellimonas sp.]|uniref:glycoside hydrolase family 97 protein n=1 Tax=Flagellimonas sp. TaxID=2058762 RepID=UPI003B5AFEEA
MIFSKYKILSFAVFALLATAIKAQDYSLLSPNGSIALKISVGENINYAITVDGQSVLKPSALSMTVNDNITLGKSPKVIKSETRSVSQVLKPEVRVKSETIVDNFNELTLSFKGRYAVAFRAYDNGVAYRFKTNFRKELTVVSETVTFNFEGGNDIYFPRESEFQSHNERLYEFGKLDTLSTEDLASLPTLLTAGKNKLLITETGLLDYPGMWLTGGEGNTLHAKFPPFALEQKVDKNRWTDDRTIRVSKAADYIAKTTGKRSFPWRVICIAKNDADLLTNQLSYQLAEPSKIEDISWIKPGKVAWDWWNYNNIYGVDFEAGVNTETYKYYIDFAAKYGIDYIMLDEGWYVLGDALKIVDGVDAKEIIRYGKEKNVDVLLWVTWSSLDQKLEEALDAYRAWGAKGVKVDFMQRDDQWMVKYYERVAKACAERQLLVDFHGSYKPSGLRRTYPNVMTREGVKGAENNKWASYITPEHNLTIPFIRMVAGPMDYTPGAMINANEQNYAPIFNRPMSMGTRCHQLAMYTIYESPLQMLCDNPSNYLREPETTEFIAQFPAVWDESIVLDAKVSDYVAMARRNGNKWFLGAMTDGESRTMDISLSFLKPGTYSIEIFEDGINASRYACDYIRSVKNVTEKDVLPIKMAPGGGWSAIITPTN